MLEIVKNLKLKSESWKKKKYLRYIEGKCDKCNSAFPSECGNCLVKSERDKIEFEINQTNLMTMEFFY